MQRPGRKCFAGFLSVALGYIALTGIAAHLTKGTNASEAAENQEWVASGRLWIDRQMCRWIGMCGTFHYLNRAGWTWSHAADEMPKPVPDFSGFWTSGEEEPDKWSEEERGMRQIPQYVWDHAPYVHLFSGENFWPCDIAEHLVHTTPHVNYTTIEEMEDDRNLTNLNDLNRYEGGRSGRFIYLQSDDNVEERPHWLGGNKNIPSTPELGRDTDFQGPWPNLDDLKDFDLESAKQEALENHAEATKTDFPYPTLPTGRTPSRDGRCGGNTGFTCEGSKFGQCCSIYGWCGKSDAYCGDVCDPLAGKCPDPFARGPHTDLRRRKRKRTLDGEKHKPQPGGRSSAPAILVVVPKGNGVVDAFWFFFYSYNLGNKVLNVRFGNHVGDWEHTVIRFKDGQPDTVFLSEHNFGEAYAYHAIEKYLPSSDGTGTMIGTWSNDTVDRLAKRPVVYSATGSHAMYGTPGVHPYVLPWGLLHDQTDRGPLWDPAQNAHAFVYNTSTLILRSSTHTPKAPVEWFHYAGHWGDKYYPLSDPRQYRFAGQYHYVNGPTGPKFKNLGRKAICQSGSECHIRHWLGGRLTEHLPVEEDVEEGGLPGGNSTEGA